MRQKIMDKNKPEEVQEAMISVGVGTAIGASASAVVGGMGLAVGGTALRSRYGSSQQRQEQWLARQFTEPKKQ
jgi:hypothetical protein